MWVWEHVSVHVSMCVIRVWLHDVQAYRGQQLVIPVLFSTLPSETGRFTEQVDSLHKPTFLQTLDPAHISPVQGFYMDDEELTSGSYTCMASTFLTEPSPQSKNLYH